MSEKTDVFEICGTDTTFCGPQAKSFDITDSSLKLEIKPTGNFGLQAKQDLVCVWDVTYSGFVVNWKFSLYYELLNAGNRLPSMYRMPMPTVNQASYVAVSTLNNKETI